MIYTSYEMIRDCRADKPEGWSYFITHYVPAIRRFIAHYFPEQRDDAKLVERVLVALREPESNLFETLEPAPERYLIAGLRQRVLSILSAAEAQIELDLETLGDALQPLTVMEKEAVWFETMRYGKQDVSRMLRMSEQTVEKIRARAEELIRGKVDSWRRGMIAENGAALGRAAAAQPAEDCIPAKLLFDIIDGRSTWQKRDEIERHAVNCWHCIDHFCRLWEVTDVLRSSRPLTEQEAEPFKGLLGIRTERPPVWKRFVGR